MTLKEIREVAREKNVKIGKVKKETAIRVIQRAEGNFDCFGTAFGVCDQAYCLWREDCLH